MNPSQLTNILLDQSKDPFWMVDLDFQLVYANKAYLNLMKERTSEEIMLNESVFVEALGASYIEKWKSYYERAFTRDYFEIEEHFYNQVSNEIQYGQTTFESLLGEDHKIFAVACHSKDITRIVKQRSEANQLIDSSLDVFCTVDEQGNFMYVSAASLNHWGYTPEELIGTSFRDLLFEEDKTKTNEIIDAIISGQEINSFVNRYKKKDGNIAYNLWSARWDNNTKLRYAVAKDYQKKIEQDEIVQQSEQRFKALVQDGSDLIAILDADGNYIYVSPTSISVLGMKPEDFIGKSPFEFIHPDDIEKVLASLQKIVTENKVVMDTFRFQNHKKEWRWMETVLTNMQGNPAVNGIVANSRDITEKIKEQHKLKLLESVITNTTDAILITEAEPFEEPGNKIIYVNEAFTKLTGYSEEDVIGKTPRILQGPNSNKEELAALGRKMRNWETCELTTINYKKSGEEFWINFKLTPVADEKGYYTHWISIERDVTEQKNKELENELLSLISINFNEENELINASKKLCKSLSEFGKFDWVEVWITNLEKSHMQLFSHYVAAAEDEKFYDYSSDLTTIPIDVGLAGKVWAQQEQILWADIQNSNDFVRKNEIKKIELSAVLGIPIISDGDVMGVLKIGTKQSGNYLSNYSQLFKNIEGFIGSEFKRKKLENDLTHLFDTIPDILCLLDFEGRFLKINNAGCKLLRYTEEEILYHSFDKFIHPDDKNISFSEVLQSQYGENTSQFENRYRTKDGEIIWLSWYCNPSFEEGLIYATAKNITEEKKLRELNRQAGALAKIGSWELDLIKQTLFWSDEIHQMHETDPNTFEPDVETGINFYREDFRPIVKSSVEKSINTGEHFYFEAVLVTATKKELWVRVIGNVDFLDGKCIRLYGSFQDISTAKETENRLLAISENLPGIVFQYLIKPDGTNSLRYVSKGVEKIWGFTAEQVIENSNLIWEQIKLGGDFEKINESIANSIKNRSKWNTKIKYVMPNGEMKTHIGHGIPTFLTDGSIMYNSIVLDITQEAKNEELLEETNKIARLGSWEINLLQRKDDEMYWSKMVREILEVDDSFIPTLKGSLKFYNGKNSDKVDLAITNLIETGLEFDEELLLRTAKGNPKWVRIIGKSSRVANKCIKIYGSFQDINESKIAELEILESGQKYRLLSQQLELQQIHLANAQKVAKVGSWETNLRDFTVSWSDETYRIFGIKNDSENMTHEKFLRNVHPLDRAKVDKALGDSLVDRSKSHHLVEHRIVTTDGVEKIVEERWKIDFDDKGSPLLAVGSCQDITQRKKAEESILQFNERFEKVTEATNDAIWDWDIENKTYYRSKAIDRFFGKKYSGVFPDTNLWNTEHFHPEDLIKIKHSFFEALENPATTHWELEYRVINKQGKTIYVIDRAIIIRNKEAKAIRVVGAMTDISEQKQMTVQLSELNQLLQQHTFELERSNQELEQFAFVASHDLQEPLRMVSSFMELLQRKYGDLLDEKGHQYIHFATDGAKRMKQIIHDLLDYSRAGRSTEGKEEVEMNEVLSEFKLLRRKLILEKNAIITSKELPTLSTYKAAITQILHCLLDNALKYAKENTPPIVDIVVAENKNEWKFSVSDNGIGIDPQFFSKIFIIFQRLHNKDDYPGTGIGLSIAKRQVEFLGGQIWLDSTVGEGTTFYFTIPKTTIT